MKDGGCKKCGNKIGFAFGTCVECGWNYLDSEYRVIKVNVDYLPEDIKRNLIEIHDDRVKYRG